jgi:hypothetical protein
MEELWLTSEWGAERGYTVEQSTFELPMAIVHMTLDGNFKISIAVALRYFDSRKTDTGH